MNAQLKKPKTVKKRLNRLILGVILPPLVAALIMMMLFFIIYGNGKAIIDSADFFQIKNSTVFITIFNYILIIISLIYALATMFAIIALGSTILSGIQSLVYSFLMEYIVNPKTRNYYIAILSGGFLGALSGIFINFVFWKNTKDFHMGIFVTSLGFVVGVIVSWILRKHYVKYENGE